MKRHELTEEQWVRIAELLPPQKPAVGRPGEDWRRLVTGIVWRAKTGVPWRDLPERSGKWATVYRRFRRWQLWG